MPLSACSTSTWHQYYYINIYIYYLNIFHCKGLITRLHGLVAYLMGVEQLEGVFKGSLPLWNHSRAEEPYGSVLLTSPGMDPKGRSPLHTLSKIESAILTNLDQLWWCNSPRSGLEVPYATFVTPPGQHWMCWDLCQPHWRLGLQSDYSAPYSYATVILQLQSHSQRPFWAQSTPCPSAADVLAV